MALEERLEIGWEERLFSRRARAGRGAWQVALVHTCATRISHSVCFAPCEAASARDIICTVPDDVEVRHGGGCLRDVAAKRRGV